MADGSDANRLSAIGQLIEDSIGADPQRVQAAELSTERGTGERFALEQTERILDRVYQRPAQLEQIATGSPSKNESCQRSAGGRPALGQLTAKLGERNRLAALDLGKTGLEREEGMRVREDLGSLLQRLVLAYGNQSRRGRPVASHQDMLAPIADVIEQVAELAAQLTNRNGLRHAKSVHGRVRAAGVAAALART